MSRRQQQGSHGLVRPGLWLRVLPWPHYFPWCFWNFLGSIPPLAFILDAIAPRTSVHSGLTLDMGMPLRNPVHCVCSRSRQPTHAQQVTSAR